MKALSLKPRFLALAAFLFAGDLKADPRWSGLPVDLTLLTGAILGLVAMARIPERGLRARGGALGVALWFATCLPGVLHLAPTAYAFQKVVTLFTFTLLSAMAPFLLVEEDGDVAGILDAMALFALAIALEGLLGGAKGAAGAERIQAFGAGTISLGRASGILFVYAGLRLALGAPRPLATAGILALAGVAAVQSGSRGPLLGALGVLVLVPLLGRRPLSFWRPAAGVGGFLALLGATLPLAPAGSLHRLEAFLGGEYGASEQFRTRALEGAWKALQEAPLGLGWGGFATFLDPLKGLGRQYPHNLLAEATLEAGWICGAATLALLAGVLLVAWLRSRTPGGLLALAGFAFYGLNSMVSGDINDNRPLFMFIGTVLALPGGEP